MSDIQNIQSEIMTAYAAISLPVVGAPTAYKHEPIGGFDSGDLPAIVVNRGILVGKTPLSSDREQIIREYIADLYTYIYDDGDPVNATSRNNTADCIDAIEAAFRNYALTTTGVLFHEINADTGDVELYARDDVTNYVGVRFRHQVTYIKEK